MVEEENNNTCSATLMLCNVHAVQNENGCQALVYTILFDCSHCQAVRYLWNANGCIRGFGLTGLYLNQPLQTPGLWYYIRSFWGAFLYRVIFRWPSPLIFFVNNFSNISHISSNPKINHKLFVVLHHLTKKWTFVHEKWAQNDQLLSIISNSLSFYS